jgi:hypothetical protein
VPTALATAAAWLTPPAAPACPLPLSARQRATVSWPLMLGAPVAIRLLAGLLYRAPRPPLRCAAPRARRWGGPPPQPFCGTPSYVCNRCNRDPPHCRPMPPAWAVSGGFLLVEF